MKREIISPQRWQLKGRKASSAPSRDLEAYWRLLSDKNLWLLVALLTCYTSGQYGFSFWLPNPG
jgi:hypothetical protein